jgi:hypothetical protein
MFGHARVGMPYSPFLGVFLGSQPTNGPCRKEVMVVRNFDIGAAREIGRAQ